MKKEFMRIIHFSGKLFGYRKAEFKNLDGEDSFIESWAFLGFSMYKVSQNNLRVISDIMMRGEKYFDDKMVSLRKRIELEKDDEYGEAQKHIHDLKEKITDLQVSKSKLSSAVLNLKYSARCVIEDFDDMELEELR